MNDMALVFPTAEYKAKALEFAQEFFSAGEDKIDGGAGICRAPSFDFWLEVITDAPTREIGTFVPSSTFFAVVNNEIVGIVDIRHSLNEHLLKVGGNIGYSVRPSKRGRGYATEILRLALIKCRELGIKKALVTCNSDNIGSKKVILKNGGIKENEIVEEDGNIVLRFWVG